MTERPGEYAVRLGAFAAIAAVHLAVALWLLASRVAPPLSFVSPAFIEVLQPESKRRVPEVVPLPAPRMIERLPSVSVQMPEITIDAATHAQTITLPATASPPANAKAEPTEPAVEAPRVDLAYLDNPAPRYPPLSRRLGEQGRVMLRVRVNASGAVEAIEVRGSSGFDRLDVAAQEAVRRWRFIPARRGGETLAGWALVPIDFRLDPGARSHS